MNYFLYRFKVWKGPESGPGPLPLEVPHAHGQPLRGDVQVVVGGDVLLDEADGVVGRRRGRRNEDAWDGKVGDALRFLPLFNAKRIPLEFDN